MDVAHLVTAEELLRMPRGGVRRFLVRGEIVEQPPRTVRAARIATDISFSLDAHVEAHRLGLVFPGRTGYQIEWEPDTVLAPAVSYVRMDERDLVDGYHQGAPDLAIEILPPMEDGGFTQMCVDAWLDAGSKLVLLIDAGGGTVLVHRPGLTVDRLGRNGVLTGGDVIPGWSLVLADLFGRL